MICDPPEKECCIVLKVCVVCCVLINVKLVNTSIVDISSERTTYHIPPQNSYAYAETKISSISNT